MVLLATKALMIELKDNRRNFFKKPIEFGLFCGLKYVPNNSSTKSTPVSFEEMLLCINEKQIFMLVYLDYVSADECLE